MLRSSTLFHLHTIFDSALRPRHGQSPARADLGLPQQNKDSSERSGPCQGSREQGDGCYWRESSRRTWSEETAEHVDKRRFGIIARYRKKNKEQREEITRLQARLASREAELASCNAAIADLDDKLASQGAELADAHAKLETLKTAEAKKTWVSRSFHEGQMLM